MQEKPNNMSVDLTKQASPATEEETLIKILQKTPGDIGTLEQITKLYLKKNDSSRFPFKHQNREEEPNRCTLPLSSFREKYKGERLFILGNGPSLKKTPLDLLQKEYTFAMNRISLVYNSTKWRPSFFLCTTTNVTRTGWNENIRESIDLGIPSFIWQELKSYLPTRDNVFYINCSHGTQVTEYAPDEWWSDNIENTVCKFGTSILPVLQIGMYMGFQTIYLVGCDLGFKENSNPSTDQNHFHSEYGTPGFSAEILNKNMKAAHELTLRAAKRKKVEIYNATIGGELEVYSRVNFFDVIKQNKNLTINNASNTDIKSDSGKPLTVSIQPTANSFIEILDPQKIDKYAYGEGILADIRQFSLLPDKRIGWNYCMDYTWLALQSQNLFKPGMTIIDIGCGPGAIHGYLENRYGIEIIGIDMRRWGNDYVDLVGDFTNSTFRQQCNLGKKSADIILSTSAFEHNTIEDHKLLVETCYDTLKPSGRLIATFSTALTMSYEDSAHQWNLTKEQLESIYQVAFTEFDYKIVWERWHNHREIPNAYVQRYGTWKETDPSFLAAGVVLIKSS